MRRPFPRRRRRFERMSMAVEAMMPTVCLRFHFPEHPKIRARMEACAAVQRQVIDDPLDSGKTATRSIIQALYPSPRPQYPNLHSAWLLSAVRPGAVVYFFDC
ncbi:MAG: hypothetical protein RQ897_02840 [Thermoflexus sp.]|nr:hypothetical protein [Thermoflexus sp.]MDT7947268.1 hypothetical protein [Thermoflexus sp.]